ncbi:hypothetical protein HA439_26775, partial [Klebsiella pneumoniae]|nr:hypothetical protein [Klebsiella pneumoniae]
CVCGKKIGPDPRNFNQRVSLGRNDLLIRTFPRAAMTFELARMGLYWNASVEASALSEDKLRVNSRQALNLSTALLNKSDFG